MQMGTGWMGTGHAGACTGIACSTIGAFVGIVVSRDVAGNLGPFQLQPVFVDHMLLNEISAHLVDWVCHIRVEFVGGVVFLL